MNAWLMLVFGLTQKKPKRSRLTIKKELRFHFAKFSWMIFEQALRFPVSLKLNFNENRFSLKAELNDAQNTFDLIKK
jgi:hypothetical protein